MRAAMSLMACMFSRFYLANACACPLGVVLGTRSGTRRRPRAASACCAASEEAMAQVDWYIEGVEVSNCNCDFACPCQFESPRPTHGDCRGFAAVRIDKGHFGDVTLDGLCAALLYGWPGPIYEGNGECQAVIDERADQKQRDALAAIVHGKETSEGATHWWVYTMMSSTVHPPLFKRFEFY